MVELRYWSSVAREQRDEVKKILGSIVREHVDALVSSFYGAFLQHPEASSFLSHSVVQERLSHSLRGWLLKLLLASAEQELQR